MEIIVKAIRWTGLVSLPVFWLTISNSPVMAGSIGSCADNLIIDGVAQSDAAAACSDALEPEVLASCVADIKSNTDLEGNAILQACYRVRRPEELASCVSTINDSLASKEPMMALDTCRRSLLPERHAECTVDLADISEISTEEAMENCIAAEFSPSEVDPTVNN